MTKKINKPELAILNVFVTVALQILNSPLGDKSLRHVAGTSCRSNSCETVDFMKIIVAAISCTNSKPVWIRANDRTDVHIFPQFVSATCN